MQNLKRNKSVNFRVTQEEYDMIKRRQAQTKIKNLRHYLLKQAIDGRVVYVNLKKGQTEGGLSLKNHPLAKERNRM
jgi:hypothetical protein